MAEEIWRPIPFFEGIYEASDKGRIRSVDREIRSMGEIRHRKGALLTPKKVKRKQALVASLRHDLRRVEVRVHRAVLEAFIGPCPEGMEGRHWPDLNPLNNHLSNLCWDHPTKRGDPNRKPHDMSLHGSSFYKKGDLTSGND